MARMCPSQFFPHVSCWVPLSGSIHYELMIIDVSRRAGGDKVYGVFDNQFPAALKRLQFDKNLSIDNVRKLITEADGYQPHLIAPEQGYRRLIESSIVCIRGPAEAAVDAVCIHINENSP